MSLPFPFERLGAGRCFVRAMWVVGRRVVLERVGEPESDEVLEWESSPEARRMNSDIRLSLKGKERE